MATATPERTETEGRAGSARRLSIDLARFPCFPVKRGDLWENPERSGTEARTVFSGKTSEFTGKHRDCYRDPNMSLEAKRLLGLLM